MKIEAKKLLFDALNACHAIERFVAGRSFDEYENDMMLRSAVERQFGIIGRAFNRVQSVDEELITAIPDMQKYVGLKNYIIHGYATVDNLILWQTIHANVSPLAVELEAALAA